MVTGGFSLLHTYNTAPSFSLSGTFQPSVTIKPTLEAKSSSANGPENDLESIDGESWPSTYNTFRPCNHQLNTYSAFSCTSN